MEGREKGAMKQKKPRRAWEGAPVKKVYLLVSLI